MKKILTVFILLVCFTQAHAHKLNVLALYESGTLNISSYFADGSLCKECKYTIKDSDGNLLKEGTLSAEGSADVKVEFPTSFTVEVDAGMGHMAKMTVNNEQSASASKSSQPDSTANISNVNEDDLRTMIRQELSKQTAELVTAIDAGRGVTDKVIAGIGYLLGIFGLFSLYRRK